MLVERRCTLVFLQIRWFICQEWPNLWYGLNIDEASKLIKEFDSSSIQSSKESGVFTSAQQKRGFHHSTVRRNTNPNPPLSEGKQTERKSCFDWC